MISVASFALSITSKEDGSIKPSYISKGLQLLQIVLGLVKDKISSVKNMNTAELFI